MFRFGEIPQGVGRRAEKYEPPTLVEQDHLLKHLEDLRTRLVNGNDDDFVVRHASNDFDYVLGIFRRETGSWFVKKINVEIPIILSSIFSRFSSPPLNVFFSGMPTTASRRSLKPSSISFASRRRMRSRFERCGARIAAANCKFSPMVRCSSNASCCGM